MTTKTIGSTEAQNNFGRLLDDVAQNRTRYIVKRFGSPTAVIISLPDFRRLLVQESTGPRILREAQPDYVLGEVQESGTVHDLVALPEMHERDNEACND